MENCMESVYIPTNLIVKINFFSFIEKNTFFYSLEKDIQVDYHVWRARAFKKKSECN